MLVINHDSKRAFRFPVPVEGKSVVNLEVGKKKGVSVYKEFKLHDGLYILPDDLKDSEKDTLRGIFLGAGFEEIEVVDNTPQKTAAEKSKEERKYRYFALHPDSPEAEEERFSGIVTYKVGRKNVDFEALNGVITTEVKKEYDALLEKHGWLEAKPPEEIVEKDPEKEETE